MVSTIAALLLGSYQAASFFPESPVVNPPTAHSGPKIELARLREPGIDDARIIRAAFEEAKRIGATRIEFETGRSYVINGDGRAVGEPNLTLKGLKDLTIAGNGASITFRKLSYGIRIASCARLKVENLSIRWDRRLATYGTIVGEKASPAVELDEAPPADGSNTIAAVTEFDTIHNRWKAGQRYEAYRPAAKLTSNPKRFLVPAVRDWPTGTRVLVRHALYEAHAFFIAPDSEDISFDRIRLSNIPGMGWTFGGGRGYSVTNCRVARAPGAPISMTADATHFSETRGDVIVEGCNFADQGDDGLNIYNGWMEVSRVDGEWRWLKPKVWSQQMLLPLGEVVRPLDRLRWVSPKTLGILSEELAGEVRLQGGELGLKVVGPPNILPKGTLMANLSRRTSRFRISNNTFSGNRARGLMIQATDGLIENNRFVDIIGPAIQITAGNRFFYEGPGAERVIVRGNRIERCNTAIWERGPDGRHLAAISVGSETPTGFAKVRLHRDLVFESNAIWDTPGVAIQLANCENVVVRDLSLKSVFGAPLTDGGRLSGFVRTGPIVIARSQSVWIDPKWFGTTSVVVDHQSTSQILRLAPP